jgi:hypothetical protein
VRSIAQPPPYNILAHNTQPLGQRIVAMRLSSYSLALKVESSLTIAMTPDATPSILA